jgi:uncharacterized Zn ribbon protein
MLSNRICKQCNSSFKGGPRAWYCSSCRIERKKQQTKDYHQRKQKGATRSIGSIDKCIICGSDYAVNGGNQIYCPDCAPSIYLEVDRKQGMEYYENNKEKINPVRNERRHIGLKTCPMCGIEFKDHTSRICCSNPKCRKDYINKLWRERYYPKRRNKKR